MAARGRAAESVALQKGPTCVQKPQLAPSGFVGFLRSLCLCRLKLKKINFPLSPRTNVSDSDTENSTTLLILLQLYGSKCVRLEGFLGCN